MIEIAIGNPVKFEDGRVGILRDVKLTPNGMVDTSIVPILYVELEGGGIMSATANRFKPVDEFEYTELYPTVHLNRLAESYHNQNRTQYI
jgi:hypothetical protein